MFHVASNWQMELEDEEIALGISLKSSSFWIPLNKEYTFQDKHFLPAHKARKYGQFQCLKWKTLISFAIKLFEMRNDMSCDRVSQFASFSTELYKWI